MTPSLLAAVLACLTVVACGSVEELALNPVGGGGVAMAGEAEPVGGDLATAAGSHSGGSAGTDGASSTNGGHDQGGEDSGGEIDSACSVDGDCQSDDTPRCTPTGICVECLSDADCNDEKPFCDTQAGACSVCSGADCLEASSKPGAGGADAEEP